MKINSYRCSVGAVSALAVLFAASAQAVSFKQGEVEGSWDTTISYGIATRVSGRDNDIVGVANGGNAFSVNGDDGNLNYDTGVFSNVLKVTSELDLRYRNFGAFVRGKAFYDYENEDNNRERTPLTDRALELVGSDIRLLDAYVSGDFDFGDIPFSIRVGEQVVSWGESTFIQGGINAINPVDVSAIRLPGAELREALLPEGMLWASAGLTDNISIEGVAMYDWDRIRIDPPGSYFSTNDFAGQGGERVLLGFGLVSDTIPAGPAGAALAGSAPAGSVVPRDATRNASNNGQYGVAVRWFVPELNETEFGLFYLNYHSRLPIISGRAGSLAPIVDPRTGLPAGALAGDYAGSAGYFLEYPEDIQLFGLSFNTTIGTTGIALQGEISHKKDAPLQVDDVELLFAALSPLGVPSQLGAFAFGDEIPGFIERDVTQLQATATKVLGPTFGADTAVIVAEAAWTHIHNMPARSDLRLDAPATYTSGNPLATLGGLQPATENADAFATQNSWGYRLLGRLVFNNAVGAVNLTPRVAWQHDVNGISPGPGGNFLEGRKAVTVGLGATYQNAWSADIAYTNFFGAGRFNLLNDRDFISANVKYSF